jgi:glutathione S-transferase
MAAMERLKLYSGTKNASSWAMRAWLALREAGVAFSEEVVDIRRPQRFANLAMIGSFSPPSMVPVLVAGDAVIFDSLAIMEYANDVSGGRLLPADRTQRAQARAILAWQHSGLSGICTRIPFESAFYPVKRSLTPEEVAECEPLLAVLARSLAGSGGPYLFGPLSLADLALVPTVVRLTRHNLDLGSFAPVGEWTRVLLDRPSVTEWMLEADRLPHIWFDEYLLDAGQALVPVQAAVSRLADTDSAEVSRPSFVYVS